MYTHQIAINGIKPRILSTALLKTPIILLTTGLLACNSPSVETPPDVVSGSVKTEALENVSQPQPTAHYELLDQNPSSQDTSVEEVVVTGSFVQDGSLALSSSRTTESRAARAQTTPRNAATAEKIAMAGASTQLHRHAPQHAPLIFTGPVTNGENYLEHEENNVKTVSAAPFSTFSIDVDTAGYSNIRRMLVREGRLPPRDAVRLEEMINYFDYNYPTPNSTDEPLSIHTEVAVSPWNPQNKLLKVGVKGFEPSLTQLPKSNLVFLVDVSGSMQSEDKLGLIKKSLRLLTKQMNEDDRIALVVYAGAAGLVLDSTSAANQREILMAIDSLTSGGSTNGSAGIELAYQVAQENYIEGGVNRVLIASDGDMNVGVSDIDDLKELISKKRDKGIALTTLGFGTGNYNYSLMEQLADVGNGNASYIDTMAEAQKVLVLELHSTLMTIAKDVKIQVEFNPAVVAEYRLLGYENRHLEDQDFRNDKVDAGEIGAGHTVTALYELTLVGSSSGLSPNSRYNSQTTTQTDMRSNELAYVNVRYKLPEESVSSEVGLAVIDTQGDEEASSVDLRFAAAVAGFGQLLRGGKYTAQWSFDDALVLARNSRGDDVHGYRGELLRMLELAKAL